MARSKALNTYPAEYWTICERVALKGEVFQLTLNSITKALSLQGQFYAYRGALRRELDRLTARGGMEVGQQEYLRNSIQFAEVTVCWVDRDGPKDKVNVRFMPKDQTPSSVMLRSALAQGATMSSVLDADADASAKELLGKLGLNSNLGNK